MLVTRSNYALAIGLDQAYFDAVSTVDDAPSRGVVRRVDIRDMRRLSFAMNLYPHTWNESIRPYVGLGYALNFVVNASSEGSDFASPEAKDTVLQRIQDAKSRGSVVGTLGLQINWRRYAPFVQATVMPTQGAGGKFLVNGNGFTYYIEGGLRYNFGSAIEVLR